MALDARATSAGSILAVELERAWQEMALEEKADMFQGLIQAIFVRRPGDVPNGDYKQNGSDVELAKRIHIVWRDEPFLDLPGPGKRGFVPTPFLFPDANPGDAGVSHLQDAQEDTGSHLSEAV